LAYVIGMPMVRVPPLYIIGTCHSSGHSDQHIIGMPYGGSAIRPSLQWLGRNFLPVCTIHMMAPLSTVVAIAQGWLLCGEYHGTQTHVDMVPLALSIGHVPLGHSQWTMADPSCSWQLLHAGMISLCSSIGTIIRGSRMAVGKTGTGFLALAINLPDLCLALSSLF